MFYRLVYISLFSIVFFTACSTKYPLGLSEKEWETLSIEKKTQYALEQSKIDEKKREEELQRWKLQKEYELQEKKIYQERIDEVYRDGNYGDIITINLYGGYIENYKGFLSLQPYSFSLARGEIQKLELIARDKRNHSYKVELWVKFDLKGNQLILSNERFNSKNGGIIILNNGRWHKEKLYKNSKLYGYKKIKDLLIGVRYSEFTKGSF